MLWFGYSSLITFGENTQVTQLATSLTCCSTHSYRRHSLFAFLGREKNTQKDTVESDEAGDEGVEGTDGGEGNGGRVMNDATLVPIDEKGESQIYTDNEWRGR